MGGVTVFLVRMTVFVAGAAIVAGLLAAPLADAFLANPILNTVIFVVLGFGVIMAYRQVFQLRGEMNWLLQWQRSSRSAAPPPSKPSGLLAPMAKLLETRTGRGHISALAMRGLLDSLGSRLDENRETSRYLTGLMIFLGLLGTFWGLLNTVGAVGETIRNLNVDANADFVQLFDRLKRGLEAPLGGMGLAFSTSMFGLAGSLILGFLDLQVNQAQNRFYNGLEEWLSGFTRLSGAGPLGESDAGVPAYVQALLEQTADSLDNLQRTLARSEDQRGSSSTALLQLSERLSVLTDQMRAEQALLVKLTEQQMELKPVLQKLATAGDRSSMDDASRGHLRNIDFYVARLVEEASEGRQRTIEELRNEIKLLARTVAAAAEDRRLRDR